MMLLTLSGRRGITTMAAMAGLATMAACGSGSDLTGSAANKLSLSFTTRSSTGSARGSLGVSRDIAVGPANEIVIKKVQLVLDRIEISRSDATTCAGDEGDVEGSDDSRGSNEQNSQADDDCEDVARDPILVNVPVDDAVHTVVAVPVAAGTYTRLEARLDPVDATKIAALGGPSDMAGKSVRVEGTFKGVPFVYTSPLRTKLESAFNPPLVVDGTTKNATVHIDITKWFTTSSGAVIDPSTANGDGPNSQLVARNIRDSFRAFEDDDKQGDDDHEVGEVDNDH